MGNLEKIKNYSGKIALFFSCLAMSVISLFAQPPLSDKPITEPTPEHKYRPLVREIEQPRRYVINPQDLPAPNLQEVWRIKPIIIPRPRNAQLSVPKGFDINVFAEGNMENPRWMALAPNGDVFLTDSDVGSTKDPFGETVGGGAIIVLRDKDKDGTADERFVFTTNVLRPHGMAFYKDYFYVANTNSVVRFKYKSGQTKAESDPELIAYLPGRGYNEHWTRSILFSPDGKKMYVSVGSDSNVDVEPEPMRAAITEFNPDGSGKRIFASGLRNPVGTAWNPTTGVLWTTVNERDRLGDELVPDYLTSVVDNGFYGFPFAYVGKNEDPRRKGERPDLVAKSIAPEVLLEAHGSALGLVFYTGKMFPAEYQGDAFVAMRGSWNKSRRSGYKVVRVPFKNGKPVGGYEDFVSGWVLNELSNEVWGRPVGLLQLADGSLLITDNAKKIWRVSYKGKIN
jgi:glucose/arabinose dehydrogenase